ncbi:hypothetical protein ER308_18110 [Egibacter rhizosphaerae]|uniref:Uncharacterized protein n=1 Tax=Egibacter rhizosphaerae TaxID=1670831 RepID=A0A411YJC3_9ACTN|nr:hypothetical protein [Egibacter rhizosphaerae]QBI21297.1 hypothetical protein ER308_18110 [Egibacter rhizosphaerae]
MTSPTAAPQPQAGGRHLAGVDDAAVVRTTALRKTHVLARQVVELREIGLVSGEPGLGKFAVFDACYRDTLERTRQRIDRDGATEAVLRTLLADEIADTATQAELATRVRAVQAACFTRGTLASLDLYELLAAQPAAPRRAVRDPRTWTALRAYRPPHRALVCALTAAGLAIDDLRSLTLADADPDGRYVTGAHGPMEMPTGSEPFLRAKRLRRLTHGATDTDPLLTDPRGQPLGQRAAATALGDATRELGVPLLNGQAVRRQPADRRWLAGRGFALTNLGSSKAA